MDVELNKEIDYCQELSLEIKKAFSRVSNALKNRENELLRQLEDYSQQFQLIRSIEAFEQMSVLFNKEEDIVNLISTFGTIELNDASLNEFCKIEDYEKSDNDHISRKKYVESKNAGNRSYRESLHSNEDDPVVGIVQYLSRNEYNKGSVILECIAKQDPSLCLHQISSISHINNSANTSTLNETNFDTSVLSDSEQQHYDNCKSIPNLYCKCDNAVTAENQNSYEESFQVENVSDISERVRKLSMKHPVQVQQWMKQIILETETEPVSSNIMEHSHITLSHKESV